MREQRLNESLHGEPRDQQAFDGTDNYFVSELLQFRHRENGRHAAGEHALDDQPVSSPHPHRTAAGRTMNASNRMRIVVNANPPTRRRSATASPRRQYRAAAPARQPTVLQTRVYYARQGRTMKSMPPSVAAGHAYNPAPC